MQELYLVYAVVGLASVLLALISRQIRHLPFTEPLVAMLLGVLAGPAVLGLLVLEEHQRDVLLLEGSRLLLAFSVTAAALRFPARALRPLVRPVALLVVVVMPVAAFAAGAAALLLGLPLALALLVGACLCPTDPVLASSVVSGEPAEQNLPARVRQLLTAESGANDGLALPLVGLAVVAVLPATGAVDVVGRLVWEVLGGIVIGVLAGVLAAIGLKAATQHRDLARGPELVYTLLVAVAVLGVSRLPTLAGCWPPSSPLSPTTGTSGTRSGSRSHASTRRSTATPCCRCSWCSVPCCRGRSGRRSGPSLSCSSPRCCSCAAYPGCSCWPTRSACVRGTRLRRRGGRRSAPLRRRHPGHRRQRHRLRDQRCPRHEGLRTVLSSRVRGRAD